MSSDRASRDEVKTDRWIGAAIVILAFFTVLGNIYAIRQDHDLRQEDTNQRACLASSFGELTEALQTRASISREINALKDKEIDLLAQGRDLNNTQLNNLVDLLVFSARNPDRTEAERAKLVRTFIADTKRFQAQGKQLKATIAETRDQIELKTAEQAKTPVPPYPEGKCD